MEYPRLNADGVARLRDALTNAGYTVDSVTKLLGPVASAALSRNETTPGRRVTSGGSALETLVRLWPLQLPVPRAAVAEVLPLAELVEGGLLNLDGDTVRTHLSKGLGFSKEDRDAHVERLGWVASRVTRHGGAVIVAAISPYEQARKNARALVEEHGPFVEIHVRTSLDECARRDVNGLYAKAFAGEIKGFTGVDDPYEAPESPEIVVDTEAQTPEESAQIVVAKLEELGLVGAEVRA